MGVALPSCAALGRPTTEFGAIRTVSAPRLSSTRPLRPVRIVSPAFSTLSLPSATCCAPCVVSQTSPDGLPTDQTPSSADQAAELTSSAKAVRRRDLYGC